ncbi:hypothetical protein [Nibribacter koreensis]|uniref:YD repeat-containing protein n=1 Tax=Nibribacter koreensis TaxID=1084519 RepID=A0ABP8FDM6_9BACT
MKKSLFFVCLFLSTLSFSCTDKEEIEEEVKPKDLRLVKVTATDTNKPDITATYIFKYNDQGGLLEHNAINKDLVANRGLRFDNTFNAQNQLVQSQVTNTSTSKVTSKESFTYDNLGRISFAGTYLPDEDTPYVKYLFVYDSKGRVSRINLQYRQFLSDPNHPDGIFQVIMFEYDDRNNVTRETYYEVDQFKKGELTIDLDQRLTYDDKKNPFYQVGNPNRFHGHVRHLLYSYMNNWSPNNPVTINTIDYHYSTSNSVTTITQTPYSNQFTYKYNDQGFPVEIKDRTITHSLEYDPK